MTDLAVTYKIPADIMVFVNEGFLVLLSENDATKTVEFHIPSMRATDEDGRITSYSVIWVHPDFNAEFCRYYDEKPGDLPNFYVEKDTSDLGDEPVDELESADDLVEWLDRLQAGAVS